DLQPIRLAPLWTVTFVERGLPNGTAWQVGVETSEGFAQSNGTGPTIVQTWPSGQYLVEANSANGTFGLASIAVITVSGANRTETLTLYRLFSLSVQAVHFPGGAFWTITVWNPQGSWIDLGNVADFPADRLPVGAYNFTVGPPPGYVASPASGVVDLVQNVTVEIAFGPVGAIGSVAGSVQPATGTQLWIEGRAIALGAGGIVQRLATVRAIRRRGDGPGLPAVLQQHLGRERPDDRTPHRAHGDPLGTGRHDRPLR
ncbi:hypothetical protein B1B_03186, partial [mine drainage metagenome]